MFKHILIPVDLQENPLARKAMRLAVEQARHSGAQLHVMTVVPGFGMPIVASHFPTSALKEAKREVRARLKTYVEKYVPGDLPVKLSVSEGNPYEQILKQARKVDADLIIVPSFGRRGASEVLLGSNASKVVRHAHCTVVVVRP